MNEDIEISMDNIIAYSVLKQASFSHDQYPETWSLIQSVTDEDQKCLMVSPVQLAEKLNRADWGQTVSDDIFRFMEKAYKDALAEGVEEYAYDLGQLFYLAVTVMWIIGKLLNISRLGWMQGMNA